MEQQKNNVGFFQDANGNFSMMRAGFAFLIVNSAAMAWYVLVDLGEVGAASAIFGTVSGVATGLKLMQNQQEKDKDKETKTQ